MAINELNSLQDASQPVKVEVYRGLKGIRNMVNEIKVMRRDYSAVVSSERIMHLSVFFSQLMKVLENEGIKERLLVNEGINYVFKSKNTKIKFLPRSSKIPASFGIIGDKVGIMTSREPFYGIMIESMEIAETFNTCFELLWRNAR